MERHEKKQRSRPRSVVCKPSSAKRRRQRLSSRGSNDTAKKLNKGYVCSPTTHKVPAFPKVWMEFRKHNLFCDGIIQSNDNKEYSVNRAILAAVSPYFKIVFTNWLKGTEQETNRLTIDLSSTILDVMLDFAYSGQCEVNRENVQSLLTAADQFEFHGIVQACCTFLVSELTPANCVGIMQFSSAYFLTDLRTTVMRYIRQNFKEVLRSPQYCWLTADELQCILGHDELNTRYEEAVFEAIVQWIDHGPRERERHLPALLRCVRHGLLDYHFLCTTVLDCPYVMRNHALHASLAPVALPLAERRAEEVDLSLTSARPRVPYEVVFTLGGWREGAPTSVIETYDTRADRWFFSGGEVPVERAYHGLCALDNLIYMVGGMDGHDFYNTVRTYDPVTRVWVQRSCMHQARSYVSVVALEGHVYAVGGYNGRARLDSAERYSPTENQWYLIAPMSCRRSDACAAILREKIYIVGGFTGSEVLKSGEVYDPLTDQWTLLAPMLSARSGVGLVAYRDALYAIGGFDGYTRLQTGERLDPEKQGCAAEWIPVTDMFSPRSNFATVVLDDMIFVIGGFDGSTTTTYVECFDGSTCEWYGAGNLALNRSALGACVLKGLPNAREYSLSSLFPTTETNE